MDSAELVDTTQQSPAKAKRHFLFTLLGILAILLLYAFAVQVTQINLEKPLDPVRQENVLRVLRLLANPDLITIDDVTGQIGLSVASRITIERIIETIFMALLASTIGTLLAVPISFLAARNIMAPVTAPLAAIMAAVIALPVGGWFGWQFTRLLVDLAALLSRQIWVGLILLIVAVGLFWLLMRLSALISTEEPVSMGKRLLAGARVLLMAALLVLGLALLAQVGIVLGLWLERVLGVFGFLGNFIFILCDMLRLFLPALTGLIGGAVAMSYGARLGQEAVLKVQGAPARLLTLALTAVGVGLIIFAIGSVLNWLYEFDNPERWTTIPALFGGAAVGILSLGVAPKRPFHVGLTIYSITRSILNILRSIEPLIMGIVFVVWVSLGPFAGIMALTLHSIAALGKLFSEQVEGISEGPIEAITATGASRLQMIVFAVVPQIVPPFTAFALYRWDINVRMSTIIGFVGGGGIGFVLSQNIQQLRYRQASVMMLAIAIVVMALDYASSKVRSRII